MAGTIYYLDIDNGSAANNGLTQATAKKLPEDLIGVIGTADIIKQRASATPYVWTNATAANQTFFGSLALLWTNWDTDGAAMPLNVINKNSSNYYSITSSSPLVFYRVKFKFDYSGTTNTVSPLYFSNSSSAVVRYYNCEIELYKSDNPATIHIFSLAGGAGSSNFYNGKIWNSGSSANVFNVRHGGTTTSVCMNSKIYGYTVTGSFAATGNDCSLFCFNKVMVGFIGAGSYFVNSAPVGLGKTITNNSIVVSSTSLSGTGKFWRYVVNPSNANTYDNIFCNLSGNTLYGIAADSGVTRNPHEDCAVGNNLFVNCTATNITNMVESYGASSYVTDSSPGPFLSLDPTNANFLESDPADSNVIAYVKGKGLISTNMSIGFTQVASADLPAIADVRSGTVFDNGNKTGTLDLPATANVKTGVTYDGATKTGSYDGSDRWSDPGVANVRSATAYKANSLTNNRTGSLDLPTIANVKTGVSYDGATKTGTYTGADRFTVPAEADVREGVGFVDNTVSKTGLLHLTVTNDILASELKVGVTKIVKDVSVSGTYDGSERFSVPDEADVLEGVSFMDNTVSKTGSLHIPESVDPGVNNVLEGVGYVINDNLLVGERVEDYPPVEAVLEAYTTNGEDGTVSLPETTDVRQGIQYGASGSLVGNATVDQPSTDPGPGNVLKGVEYNIDGVDKVGEYDTGRGDITPGVTNIRVKVLQKIKDSLFGINPTNNAKYQNVVRTVSFEPINTQGMTQSDYPHVQIVAEENQYDHSWVLSGNTPLITQKVRLVVTTPANWTYLDCESLYEDIRQCFIRDNYTLDDTVLSIKVESFSPLNGDSDKDDQNRKAAMVMVLKFFEEIEQ